MVKNTKGGSGHKSQARKFAGGSAKTTNKATRFSQDEYEYYAQVVATLGNGMCHVMCKDGKKRLCHIRGKFRGRGMRDNMVKNGVWVLVGGRDFEAERTKDDKKLENCDLLEVYSDLDKERGILLRRRQLLKRMKSTLMIFNPNHYKMNLQQHVYSMGRVK